jgi:hypothetical protein
MTDENLLRIKRGMILQYLFAFVLLFGCERGQKAASDIKTYSLELSAPHQDSFAGAPVMLRVNDFSAVPFFNDRYLAYRSGETTYEQDFYNQLIAAPAKLIQDEVAVWLKGSPAVASVVTPSVISAAEYVIDGESLAATTASSARAGRSEDPVHCERGNAVMSRRSMTRSR